MAVPSLLLGLFCCFFTRIVCSNSSATTPVAAVCGPSTANIVCINRYGSLLPPSYLRDPDPLVGYAGTVVPDDPSWGLVSKADFVVFDRQRGLDLLGRAPRIQHKYVPVLNVIHEAPIYVRHLNKLFVTQDGPPGNLTNLVIDLNEDPPTAKSFVTDPPIYQPTGGILHDGMIYWAVQGNNVSLSDGLKQRPGIVRVDPATLKAEWLMNSYYGFWYTGLNDLTVDSLGDVWFTDSDYSYGLGLSDHPPQNQLATYRLRPSTGEVVMVENTAQRPNGITFSRDGKTLYLGDSGLETAGSVPSRGKNDSYAYPIRIDFTSTNKRNIYAFDVNRPAGAPGRSGSGSGNPYLTNKRTIFQSLEGSPDGIKVAANGYLVVATALSNGVDILDSYGSPIARIQATHPVENIAFTGPELKTLFLVGIGGITRVQWDLAGPDPDKFFVG